MLSETDRDALLVVNVNRCYYTHHVLRNAHSGLPQEDRPEVSARLRLGWTLAALRAARSAYDLLSDAVVRTMV